MIFSFFGSYAYIYSTIYYFDSKQIGLCYLPVIVGKASPSLGQSHGLSFDRHFSGFLLAVITFGIFDALYIRRLHELEAKLYQKIDSTQLSSALA